MLSTAAWNAFLKTLEEPPPHTIFVLATTEANKVPADGRRPLPPLRLRAARRSRRSPTVLRRVADAEEIAIPDEAIALVARSATGSFRDALGTLEQLLAYSGAEIALEDVLAVLGVADADLLFGAVDAVAAGDARGGAARRRAAGRVRAATSGASSATSRRTPAALLVVQALGEVPARAARHRRAGRAPAPSRPRASAAPRSCGCSTCIAAALRAMKDGADARTQLELALRQGRRAGARRVGQGAAGAHRAARRRGAPARRRAGRSARAARRRPRAAARRAGAARATAAVAPPPVAPGARAARAGDGRAPPPAAAAGRRRGSGRRGRLEPRRRARRCDGVRGALAARCSSAAAPSAPHARRRCWPSARPVALADARACTLAWPRDRGVLQAQGRGPGQPRADRRGDPGA